jgi:hypothetical protein
LNQRALKHRRIAIESCNSRPVAIHSRGYVMSHFMLDCYYPDVTHPGGLTCDSLPMRACKEADAIAEAKRIAIWKKPVRFDVRSVSRDGDKMIFAS